MPIYRYSCSKCGEFEVIQSASAKPCTCNPDCTHKDCPRDATREISRPTFQLSGDGWYKDLYGGKKDKGSSTPNAESSTPKTSEPVKKGCGSKCSCH